MKAYILENDWEPIYGISRRHFDYSKETEISCKKYREYIALINEFNNMQDELKRLFIGEINNAS